MNILRSLGHDTLCELRNCSTLEMVNRLLFKLALSLGVEYFQLTAGPANPLEDSRCVFEIGNFPPIVRSFYKDELNCLKDPTFIAALDQSWPIKWRNVFLQCRAEPQRQFIGFLRENGLYDGFTIPIHGPKGCAAILLFASSKIIQKNYDDFDSLSIFAVAIMQRVKRIMASQLIPKPSETILTGREAECLKWVLDGKTNWEIGILVGISARTVQFHLANSARKLGVTNRIQAAIKAMTNGMIKLPDNSTEFFGKISLNSNVIVPNLAANQWQNIANGESQKSHF